MISASAVVLVLTGVIALAIAVALRGSSLIFWGVAGIGSAYAVWLSHDHSVRAEVITPLLAAVLLVCCEIAFSAIDRGGERSTGSSERISWLGGTAVGSVGASTIVMLAAALDADRSLPLTIAGTVAAVAALAILRARG
jgi:hypothetical protein